MAHKPPALPVIPTPFSAIWREVRIRILPPVIFFGVAVACYFLWGRLGAGSSIPGVGEGARSIVASPYVGIINKLYVEPYQWVEQGQPLAQIAPVDPRSRLDLLQSELQIARLRLEPSLTDRNALNYVQGRVDLLRLEQELAMAKVNLVRAEKTLQRHELLRPGNLVAADIYDQSLQERDLYNAEIATKSAAIDEIKKRMEELRTLGEPENPGTNQMLMDMVGHLEQRLAMTETNWAPMILYAPISGMVQSIYRGSAEYVIEGEPLISIGSPRSERVVAYFRQPYPVDPEVGMEAEIVTRNRKRERFVSRISEIGAQVEIITNSLAFIRQGAMVDEGLPVVFPVPTDAHIRPGEIVDVILKPISLLPKAAEKQPQTAGVSPRGAL